MIPDDVAAIVQLKEGTIDVMNNIDDSDFLALQKDETYKDQFQFFSPSLTKYYVILLNNKDPKLSDKKVRRALAHLVDVDHILNKLENGFGQRLVTPVHPSKSYYHKDLKPIPFSLENAQSLLADAGWKDTNNDGTLDKLIDGKKTELVLDMYVSGQELGNQVALLLQQNALKTGIKINMIEKEFKAVRSEHIKTRNYHLVPSVVSTDLNVWDDLKTRYHSEFDNPSGANDVGYRNTEADNLLTQIPAEKDLKKRAGLYKNLQEIIYDDQPMIYLFVPSERIVINKIWQGNATQKRPGYAVNQFEMTGTRKLKK
jgi:peptide/nickel transport system substrate-binding protein